MLGILSQRLAKKLCSACKTSHQASASELLEIAEEFASVASIEKIYHQKDPKKSLIVGASSMAIAAEISNSILKPGAQVAETLAFAAG